MKKLIPLCLLVAAVSACSAKATGSAGAAGAAPAPSLADAVASLGGDTTSAAAAASSARRNSNIISASELADPTIATVDAYAAVQRLRPGFLTARGGTSLRGSSGGVLVSVDNQSPTAVSSLKSIVTSELREIRLLTPSEAGQKFGTKAANGPVIAVTRK